MKKHFRLVRIFLKFPKTVLTYFLIKILRVFPGIKIKHVIDEDGLVQKEKENRRKANQSTGHYIGNRKVIFSFLSLKLFSIKIIGEGENSLLHFYLLRKSNVFNNPFYKDLKEVLDKYNDKLIFEPGCNTGRMLYHFKDKFGGRIIGADIDEPAINVASKIVKQPDEFHCIDTVNSDFLSRFSKNEVSLCILSSHIKHTLHYDKAEEYFKTLLHISKVVIIHEKYKEDIIQLFEKFNIPKDQYTFKDDQIFGFIRAENL